MSQRPIIFTAAGSGGHIFAAIATLKAFIEKYPTLSESMLFVGSTLTMEGEKHQLPIEERICNRLGIPFTKIRMGKLQRQLSIYAMRNFIHTLYGFWDAWKLIRKIRPVVIAAFGGYVSLPIVIIGKLYGAKILLHEQSSNIGLANQVLQWRANFIGVTYDTSIPYFKAPVTVVGSPTLKHIYTIENFEHLMSYMKQEHSRLLEETDYLHLLENLVSNRKKRKFILVSGGSQGSHFLNEQIQKILPELLKEYTVFIQTGENEVYNDYQKITDYVSSLPVELGHHCIIRKFIYEEFGYLLKNADLFVGRSGANTVYQVGMTNTHAIFIPISWVTKNEQFVNAAILRDLGMATILDEKTLTPQEFLQSIQKQIISKTTECDQLQRSKIFPPDADLKLAAQIAKLAV